MRTNIRNHIKVINQRVWKKVDSWELRELQYYQYNLKKSLETLIALPAFKVVAMENVYDVK